MSGNIDIIVENALVEIRGTKHLSMLDAIETKYTGPTGLLTRSLKSADQLPASFKSVRVRAINNACRKVHSALEKKRKEIGKR